MNYSFDAVILAFNEQSTAFYSRLTIYCSCITSKYSYICAFL
jgi:hypothetical protein